MKLGRRPLYNERMQVHYVGLPPSMAADIATYGNGNIGRGVRKLWTEHQQRLQQQEQQRKTEQTKEWLRDWRSNPTASSDPLHVVVSEPGQEMLPPPDDPTTPEDALGDSGAIEAIALTSAAP